MDPVTRSPHIYGHDVDEQEVLEVLENPGEDRIGRVLAHYENQTEKEAELEDECGVGPSDLKSVFVVSHVHKFDDGSEDDKLIGIYRTEESAKAAIERLRTQPGFVDAPEGFVIDLYWLDHDSWTEGYTTIHHR